MTTSGTGVRRSSSIDRSRTRSCGGSRSLPDATAQLSPELKDRHRDIPWREVYGFRNIAAHAYLDIDLERVWEIVIDHLPPLRTAVEKELGGDHS